MSVRDTPDNPLITWLLPVKNGMPYLPETLASLEAQTYRSWKILVWDNGSTDGTLDELKRWIPDRLPGKIITGRPLGLAESLRELVLAADTELCARIDADDLCAPDRLEKQAAFLSGHPEIAVVGSQMTRLDSRGVDHGPFFPLPTDPLEILYQLLFMNPMAHPAVLFRREAVLSAGNYRYVGPVNVEDYDLWLRMSASGYRLANLPEPLLHYRVHEKSATQISQKENQLQQALEDRIKENIGPLLGLSPDEALALRNRNIPKLAPIIRRIVKALDRIQPIPGRSHRNSETLISILREKTMPSDLEARVMLQLWRNGVTGAALSAVRKAGGVGLRPARTLAQSARQWRSETSSKRWIQSQLLRGGSIHQSLEVTGGGGFGSIELGAGPMIERDVTLWLPAESANRSLKIADMVFIGRNTYIGAYEPITIGSHTMIGAYSYIISANHSYQRRDIPIMFQGFEGAPVHIEDDVWLGTHVVVLPGVTIGRGAIVGAGSIVNKSIPPYQIWAGAPARFIRERP